MKPSRWWLVLVLLGSLPASAQEVQIRGDDRSRAADVAREILQRASYLRLDRDTVLPETFHTTGDLVVVGADVRLAGRVEGSIAVLGGHLFLRRTARVGGQIAVMDGGVYPSGQAQYGPIFESNPSTRVTVGRAGDTTVVATLEPPAGRRGLSFGPSPFPTYDRVNGVTLSAGAAFPLTPEERGATVAGWVSFRHRNDEDPWGGGARIDVPIAAGFRAAAELSRATRTNDAWARSDLSNSIAALTGGEDYRDYYDADRLTVSLGRPLMRRPLLAGESWFGPRIAFQAEEARSLPVREPWSLFGELDRFNPPVWDGQINSGIVGAELHWVGRVSRLALDGQVEAGHRLGEVLGGESDFTQMTAHGIYSATAFRTHTLRYTARVVMPLGEAAPEQREGILGGIPTIPTLDPGAMRGDHLVFASGSYGIPMPRVVVPFLGVPTFEVHHAVGSAWRTDESAEWVQNIGVGIQFSLIGARVSVDPEDVEHPRAWLTVGGFTR